MRRLYVVIGLLGLAFLTACTEAESKDPDYWLQSELCDSKKECIELGDQHGEEIFSILERAFGYFNHTSFLYVGLETEEYSDQYTEDGMFSFDDYLLAEHKGVDGQFEQVSGEEHPFYTSMTEFVPHLLVDDLIDIDSIQFLSEGYPFFAITEEAHVLGLTMMFADFSEVTVYTILHELAHALTFKDIKSDDACYEEYTLENCFETDSHMLQFAEQFWTDFPDMWLNSDTQSMTYEGRKEFYEDHSDQFVTRYAPVLPSEDIAESFSRFVLSPYKEEAESIAEEKINFFYQFDELVEYRAQVLQFLQETYEEKGDFFE